MKFQMAYKGLRHFKRAHEGRWLEVDPEGNVVYVDSGQPALLRVEDFEAVDWMVKERSVTITRTKLYEAYVGSYGPNIVLGPAGDTVFEMMAQRLGLGLPKVDSKGEWETAEQPG